MRAAIITYLVITFSTVSALAQDSVPSPNVTVHPDGILSRVHVHGDRVAGVIMGETVLGAGSVIGLSTIWYQDFEQVHFHTFNDSREWLQMDKAGHVTTSYYISKIGIGLLKWSGFSSKKAALFGGPLGLVYQTGLEMLDGYSSGWGFSWSDMGANAAGSLLCTGEELLWHEQRINLKVSYHATNYPNYRPEILGSSPGERIIKDYNGQTYWLSANISAFMKQETKFPGWLDVAVGYGADGMTGGSSNPQYNSKGMLLPGFDRTRKFFFSLDADLWRIRHLPPFLKAFTQTFGFIRIPFPALELSSKGVALRPLYF